jgi:hypothetical protein
VQVLWRVEVEFARRNKGVWSSLGLGLSLVVSSDILIDSLGDIIGDVLAKYGASLRE